jgi:hypothetical protein
MQKGNFMFYEILDFHYKNEQPELAFENDCDSAEQCIDMFISMLVDLIGEVDEHDQLVIDKLQAGDYELHEREEGGSIIVRTY